MSNNASQTDKYIDSFPGETQQILMEIRRILNETVPGAEETISYGIPTLKLNGKYVIYFAGYKNHVSVYPVHTLTGDKDLQQELKPYLSGRGTAKFPLDQPIPYDLIRKIAERKLRERMES